MKNQKPKFTSSEIVLFTIVMLITAACGTMFIVMDGTVVDALIRLCYECG